MADQKKAPAKGEEADDPGLTPLDPGTWVTVEYDDEGKLTVEIHAAHQYRQDASCHYGQVVNDQLPDDVDKTLRAVLKRILDAGGSAREAAKRDAIKHLNYEAGIALPNTVQMKFEGSVEGRGKTTTARG